MQALFQWCESKEISFRTPRNEQGEVITKFPQRFDGWKKVHYAVPDRTNNGTTCIAIARAQLELDSLALLLQKLSFGASNADDYKIVVDAFYNAMIDAWGAHNITPYMHILKVHGPYFAKEGSLAIWSRYSRYGEVSLASTLWFSKGYRSWRWPGDRDTY